MPGGADDNMLVRYGYKLSVRFEHLLDVDLEVAIADFEAFYLSFNGQNIASG